MRKNKVGDSSGNVLCACTTSGRQSRNDVAIAARQRFRRVELFAASSLGFLPAPEDVADGRLLRRPERRRIESLIRELGLSDRVEMVGMVPHERALEIIATASVAVFTGMREEGGLALAEAMLLGTPVVVLSNGGAAAIASAATDPSKVSLVEPAGPRSTADRMAAAIDHQLSSDRSIPGMSRLPLIDQDAANERLETLVQAAVSARRWSNS